MAVSDWKRITTDVPLEDLPPEMIFAINQHIEQHNLGPILSDRLMCIRTDSEKIKKSLFGGAEVVKVGAIVTPRWLIWAIQGTKTRTAILSAQLINITIQDYAKTLFTRMIPDSGIEVSGLFTDAGESSSAFIGLGEGTAANEFKEIVLKAAQDAKK
jgi:hypothetical protein